VINQDTRFVDNYCHIKEDKSFSFLLFFTEKVEIKKFFACYILDIHLAKLYFFWYGSIINSQRKKTKHMYFGIDNRKQFISYILRQNLIILRKKIKLLNYDRINCIIYIINLSQIIYLVKE